MWPLPLGCIWLQGTRCTALAVFAFAYLPRCCELSESLPLSSFSFAPIISPQSQILYKKPHRKMILANQAAQSGHTGASLDHRRFWVVNRHQPSPSPASTRIEHLHSVFKCSASNEPPICFPRLCSLGVPLESKVNKEDFFRRFQALSVKA